MLDLEGSSGTIYLLLLMGISTKALFTLLYAGKVSQTSSARSNTACDMSCYLIRHSSLISLHSRGCH